ncbi:MAG: FAD:protein FMN transferase [Eubacteriales bacterium]|nr:FAD:protein FMN transferase [Eubacteriales bacterium]
MNKRTILAAAVLVTAALLSGAALRSHQTREETHTGQLLAMDTVMTFTAYGPYGEQAVEAAMEEIRRLDALLSAESGDSEVSALNRLGEGTLSEEGTAILKRALEVFDETGGLFDCTIYPVMELWGFTDRQYHVPSEAELSQALALVDASRITLDEESGETALGEGQRIDFGGIAKGYASGRVMDIFRSAGVVSGMVSLGGNVQTLGEKPDRTPWRIGIQDPDGAQGDPLAVVSVTDRAVITSGGYERYFEEDGRTYIHIIDPRTGRPAESGLASVTVVSADGMLADALSTSLYIMGAEEAERFWRSRADEFDMMLVTEDGEILLTEGLSDSFESAETPVILKRDR